MKSLRALPLLVLGMGALLVAALPSSTPTPTYEDVVVRKGFTASYIAFTKYGLFNDSIASLMKADNPGLANLDAIKVGQTLRIRKAPSAPQETALSNPLKTVQLASRRAIITLASGTGSIRRANGSVEPLKVNISLGKGDAIATGPDGYAELIIDNQSVMRLNHDTELRLASIQEPRAANSKDQRPYVTRLALLRGKTWTHVQKWAGGIVNYQIQLPTAIAGVHGTVFESEVASDSTSAVGVIEGEVGVGAATDTAPAPRKGLAPKQVDGPKEISLGEWIRLVKTGMRLVVPKSGTPGEPQPWKPSETEWKAVTDLREAP